MMYRPGQEIMFKVIALNLKDYNKELIKNKSIRISVKSPNGQEIFTQQFKTNSFGSFSGKIDLPKHGKNGQYSKSVYGNSGRIGLHYVNVEEYKRPKFELHFDNIDHPYIAGDSIKISGKIVSYSGVQLSNTKLSYHIYQQKYFYSDANNENAKTGSIKANENGHFELKFKSTNSLGQSYNYNYNNIRVKIIATEKTGESHSFNKRITLNSYYFNKSTLVKDEIAIEDTILFNLDIQNGDLHKFYGKGFIKIFKLKHLNRVLKKRYWPNPDTILISKSSYIKDFPHLPYKDEQNPHKWKNDILAKRFLFNGDS